MKVYLSKINESWVVDRMREEWYSYNQDISSETPEEADVIGLFLHGCGIKNQRKF